MNNNARLPVPTKLSSDQSSSDSISVSYLSLCWPRDDSWCGFSVPYCLRSVSCCHAERVVQRGFLMLFAVLAVHSGIQFRNDELLTCHRTNSATINIMEGNTSESYNKLCTIFTQAVHTLYLHCEHLLIHECAIPSREKRLKPLIITPFTCSKIS